LNHFFAICRGGQYVAAHHLLFSVLIGRRYAGAVFESVARVISSKAWVTWSLMPPQFPHKEQ
jgi:hypothetical protein